ncbi:BZ3500_MvSof-1268-A1-R1_Chr1-3g01584 [Microbotryum saponariae]|uniref:BZ3500_MvSof-1268-A1-R1_Chr1-3g01584 protein n=1 Tax=Microbotryum saponariae TaxID=289078 RepID=A0A2X0KE26_9BASI|nr:BZ3500_MvSof-1268-A1-R1_Chr1-3g01584 [Microbotryum saponariae]SCZ94092.1 BZ3501_MvSof-1269-A2-R1_Chr1-3g01186 [Microbotryum saponariae]
MTGMPILPPKSTSINAEQSLAISSAPTPERLDPAHKMAERTFSPIPENDASISNVRRDSRDGPPASPVSPARSSDPNRRYSVTGNERVFPMRNVVHPRPLLDRRKTSIKPDTAAVTTNHGPVLRSPPLTNRSPHPMETPMSSRFDDTRKEYFPAMTHTPRGSTSSGPSTGPTTEADACSPGDAKVVGSVGLPIALEQEKIVEDEARSVDKLITPAGVEMWFASVRSPRDEGGEVVSSPQSPLPQPIFYQTVQAFGVLFALEEDTHGNFKVMQVSENSEKLLGVKAETWLSIPNFTALLEQSSLDTFLDAVDALDDGLALDVDLSRGVSGVPGGQLAAAAAVANNFSISTPEPPEAQRRSVGTPVQALPPEQFRLTLLPSKGEAVEGSRSKAGRCLHCAMHRPDPVRQMRRFLLEVELVNDVVHPLATKWDPPAPYPDSILDDAGPVPEGSNGPSRDPTVDQILESTVSLMKPLRALGKRRAGNSSEINMVQLVFQIEEQLRRAKDLETFLSVTVGIFKELTQFDRALILQFDDDLNALVVGEHVDRTRGPHSATLYRDLTFPVEQLPCESLEQGRIGIMYDRTEPLARMLARTQEEARVSLDLSKCSIRPVDPSRFQVLASLGCQASMSVPLYAFGKIWGFVAVHSYAPTGQRVSVAIRQLCAYLGDSLSRTIERLSYERRLQARKIINTSANSEMPTRFIANGGDLLDLFSADFGCLSVGEEAKILGDVGNSQELFAVLEYLRDRQFRTTQASNEVMLDFPDLKCADPEGLKQIAGILVIPLSESGADFIFFARRSTAQTISWVGGNPADSPRPTTPGGHLQFEVYRQTFTRRSKYWSDESIDTAGVLGLIYSKFISVWREKEQAMQANSITSLLLANASHEVRTPLNAILNFLELALDASTDGAVNENLQRTHDASKSLIHVINDLLDLTRFESGAGELFVHAPFNLRTTIEDAISLQKLEAKRRGISMEVFENPQGTPTLLIGDRAKIRQILSTTVANAVKYTESGSVTIEYGEMVDDPEEVTKMVEASKDETISRRDSIRVGISVTDTGRGMPEEQLNALFSELHHVKQETSQPTGIGLGLAVAARIVQQLDGQLRVESELGQGSKFTFIFPFRLPDDQDLDSDGSSSLPGDTSQPAARPLIRRTSSGSRGSRESVRSRDSRKSEIDSLINAISQSHLEKPHRRTLDATLGGAKNHVLHALGGRTLSRSVSHASFDASLRRSPNAPSNHLPRLASSLSLSPPNASPALASHILVGEGSTRRASGMPSLSPPPLALAGATDPNAQNESGLNILVVEDEYINRTLLERRLVKDGHRVMVVEHGGLTLDALRDNAHFDLILMDLNMPIMDGYDASSAIRREELLSNSLSSGSAVPPPQSHILNRGIPILAVSANIEERARARLVEHGIDGWCLKPVRFLRLAELIKGATDVAQRKCDLYKPGEWEKGGWLHMHRGRQSKKNSHDGTS